MDTCKKYDKFCYTLLHPTPNKPRKPRSQGSKNISQQISTNNKSNQTKPSTTSKLSTTPGAKIFWEAIRSLAHLLCANTSNSIG